MRKTLSLLAAVACLAASAVAQAFEKPIDAAVSVYRTCTAFVVDLFKAVLVGPALLAEPDPLQPERPLLRARAFVLRLLKRDRPVITDAWRMCPST